MATRVVNAESDDRALTTQNREIAVQPEPESGDLVTLSIQEMKGRFRKIQEAINDVLKDGIDYGIVPGTSRKDAQGNEIAKPSLYKSGAEKLATLFLFDAEFDDVETYQGDHLTVTSTCTLYHIPTGRRVGSGSGKCSTKESKYAYRFSGLKCPACGKESLIHTKRSPTDWWCSSYKQGCGLNFTPDDPKIAGQERGQVANDKLADQWNTVLKMAQKRAKVAAVIGATGASEFVTQDLEDLADNGVIVDTGSGASKPADTTGGPKDAPKEAKGAQKGSNASKKADSKVNGTAKGADKPADAVSDADVAEMEAICKDLDADPDEIVSFYASRSPDAKTRIKSLKDFTPGEMAHFKGAAAEQKKKGAQADA